ncbi:hypothetical protein FKM82_016387 [Ascaphus truei]
MRIALQCVYAVGSCYMSIVFLLGVHCTVFIEIGQFATAIWPRLFTHSSTIHHSCFAVGHFITGLFCLGFMVKIRIKGQVLKLELGGRG